MLAARSLVLVFLILEIISEYGIVEGGGGIRTLSYQTKEGQSGNTSGPKGGGIQNIDNQSKGEQSGNLKPSTDQTDHKASGCGNCVFPFIFSGMIFETCTSIDGDPLWCATAVDSDGFMQDLSSWEYCTSNSCPEPEPMVEHPENEAGNCYCGIPNTGNGNRIVGGVNTEVGEYPWQIALLNANNIRNQICGGALVSDRYVVTAAHCTYGRTASDLFVAVGDTILGIDDDATSFIYPVKTVTDHPDYDDSTTENDISLLELDGTIDLTAYPNIKPICLPAQGTTYGNKWATVSGWGTIESGQPSPAHLNEADVQIFADGDCGSMNSDMTSDMICAGIKAGGKDSCQGDSGGPLFLRDDANNGAHTLAGVVSWGYGCADADSLGIYAEVSHFRDWLDTEMTTFSSCPAPPTGTVPTASPPIAPPKLDCWEKNQYLYVKTIRTIKEVKDVDTCTKECFEDGSCEFYKWQKHRKLARRTCYLQKLEYKGKKNMYAGPRVCPEE